MSDTELRDRMEAADKAKQAMLEKFRAKAQAAEADPALVAARMAQAKAREVKRAAAEERRKTRIEEEKISRVLEAEAKATAAAAEAVRLATEAEAKRLADIEAAEILAFQQKAARDLRYAARKARK